MFRQEEESVSQVPRIHQTFPVLAGADDRREPAVDPPDQLVNISPVVRSVDRRWAHDDDLDPVPELEHFPLCGPLAIRVSGGYPSIRRGQHCDGAYVNKSADPLFHRRSNQGLRPLKVDRPETVRLFLRSGDGVRHGCEVDHDVDPAKFPGVAPCIEDVSPDPLARVKTFRRGGDIQANHPGAD